MTSRLYLVSEQSLINELARRFERIMPNIDTVPTHNWDEFLQLILEYSLPVTESQSLINILDTIASTMHKEPEYRQAELYIRQAIAVLETYKR